MTSYQTIGLVFALVGLATGAMLWWESRQRKSLDLTLLPQSNLLIWVTRILVGLLFIYSGFVKANDYLGFAYKLEEYFFVFGEQFPALKGFFHFFIPWAGPMAWFISVFEVALAVALLLGWRMNLTAWLTLLMMVFFTILTGYSHVTGAVTDCGCFGDALKLAPWESFVKDIILTAMLLPVFLVRRSIRPLPNGRIAGIATGIVFLATGYFSYYCHEHLPLIDYRAYKVGVDLNICITVMGPEGYPPCKDWYPEFLPEEFPEGDPGLFSGSVLMIVVEDVRKAPEAAGRLSAELAGALQGGAVRVVGVTSSGEAAIAQFRQATGAAYPFALLDETVLKTIIRSHPGYVLLKDGVVLGKWHYNDTPTAATLQAMAAR
ncbi:MAG: DoxX family protein [Bacteroidia bacterium]